MNNINNSKEDKNYKSKNKMKKRIKVLGKSKIIENKSAKNNKIKNNINDHLNKKFKSNKIKNKLNLTNFRFKKHLIDDVAMISGSDNKFCIFKSIDDIICILYQNFKYSIILYNYIDNKKIVEIKNSFDFDIYSFKYFFDKINHRDLIAFYSESNLQVWDMNYLKILIDGINIKKNYEISSTCFLEEDNKIYIAICSNKFVQQNDKIKIYDIKGNFIKELNNSDDCIICSETYFDNNLSKNYIVTGNYGYSKSYDFKENKLYHIYKDGENNISLFNKGRPTIIINGKNEIVNLIESSWDGYIRVWNFHSGLLLKKLFLINGRLGGICLWNSKYIFVGCENKTIKLIDLRNNLVIKELESKDDYFCLKIFFFPKYGKSLLSLGFGCKIKLWSN